MARRNYDPLGADDWVVAGFVEEVPSGRGGKPKYPFESLELMSGVHVRRGYETVRSAVRRTQRREGVTMRFVVRASEMGPGYVKVIRVK